jgi:hypothetical protein
LFSGDTNGVILGWEPVPDEEDEAKRVWVLEMTLESHAGPITSLLISGSKPFLYRYASRR